MSKKFLVIAYYFPPLGGGGVQRTTKFVRYLPDFDWEPIVLTIDDPAYSIFDNSLLDELPPDLSVYRTKAFQPTKLYFKMKQRQTALDTPSPSSSKKPALSLVSKRLRNLGVGILNWLLIPDDKIGWVPYALREAHKIIKHHQPSLIYTTSAPFSAHIIGARLAKLTGLPWVADFVTLSPVIHAFTHHHSCIKLFIIVLSGSG